MKHQTNTSGFLLGAIVAVEAVRKLIASIVPPEERGKRRAQTYSPYYDPRWRATPPACSIQVQVINHSPKPKQEVREFVLPAKHANTPQLFPDAPSQPIRQTLSDREEEEKQRYVKRLERAFCDSHERSRHLERENVKLEAERKRLNETIVQMKAEYHKAQHQLLIQENMLIKNNFAANPDLVYLFSDVVSNLNQKNRDLESALKQKEVELASLIAEKLLLANLFSQKDGSPIDPSTIRLNPTEPDAASPPKP